MSKKDHGKKCWCSTCTKVKAAAFRIEYLEKVKLMTVVRPPATKDALIPVRAHFRRSASYLTGRKPLLELAKELSKPYREKLP